MSHSINLDMRGAWKATIKHEINDGGILREFVVKEALRGLNEKTRFIVNRSS